MDFFARLWYNLSEKKRGANRIRLTPWFLMVGMTGFEPAAPCSRSRCATRLRYIPKNCFYIPFSSRLSSGKTLGGSRNG